MVNKKDDRKSLIEDRYTREELELLWYVFNNSFYHDLEDNIIDLFKRWDDGVILGTFGRTFKICDFLLFPLEDMPLYLTYSDCLSKDNEPLISNFSWAIQRIAAWRLKIGR